MKALFYLPEFLSCNFYRKAAVIELNLTDKNVKT
jgi:hypothetical protein